MKPNARFEVLIQALSHEFEVLQQQNDEFAEENCKLRELAQQEGKPPAAREILSLPRELDLLELPEHSARKPKQSLTARLPSMAASLSGGKTKKTKATLRAITEATLQFSPSSVSPGRRLDHTSVRAAPKAHALSKIPSNGSISPEEDGSRNADLDEYIPFSTNHDREAHNASMTLAASVQGTISSTEESRSEDLHNMGLHASTLTNHDKEVGRSKTGARLEPVVSEEELATLGSSIQSRHILDSEATGQVSIGKADSSSLLLATVQAVPSSTTSGRSMMNGSHARMDHPSRLILALETIPAAIIMMNALTIAFSADIDPKNNIWDVFEVLFVSCYAIEAALKMYLLRCSGYFCGGDMAWNWFDFLCLFASLTDLACSFIFKAALTEDKSYQLLKILRVARLTRLVRVLRYRFFDELRAMVLGVISGVRVLFWAIVLLFYCIFFLGVMMNSVFGEDEKEFRSVPHSMLVVFRCYTDGCTTYSGTPLQERMFSNYGAFFMIGYILSFMFVTVGVFNLIMAIFIDNVLSSSLARKLQSIGDNTHINEERIRLVLFNLIARHVHDPNASESEQQDQRLSFTNFEDRDDVKISKEVFNEWLDLPEMICLLEDVNIETSTRSDLFDVLDVDMGGELEMDELRDGLMRLRGPITKSDIVAVRLKVTYMTKMVEGLYKHVISREEEKEPISLHDVQKRARLSYAVDEGIAKNEDGFGDLQQDLDNAARRSVFGSKITGERNERRNDRTSDQMSSGNSGNWSWRNSAPTDRLQVTAVPRRFRWVTP